MIQQKKRSLLSSTSLVSFMTLISRISGFARDMVMAQMFGAVAGMDAFYVAFRIPNFMRRLFAEGAFSQAFVPVLAEYQKRQTPQEVLTFISRILGQLSFVLFFVTLVGIWFSPQIITIFAPGFHADGMRHVLASEMIRITFPYLFFISLAAMSGAVLNTYGYFGVPAITPIFLNLSMIFAAFYFVPLNTIPVKGLAYGVLLAGIVQCLFPLPFLYKHGLLVRPRLALHDEGVRRVLRLMVPALFGVSIAQINLMIDTVFASFLQVGSVTWLYFTDRLTDFPLGVFGVAISTVILPHLSRNFAAKSHEHFSSSLDWGLRLLLLIGLPSGIGLAVCSMPMIASCFGYGKFGLTDLIQTQKSTITLALGIPAFMMVKVLASGFYATQDIKTPVKIGVWVMIVNSIGCLLLVPFFKHAGLTAASSLASYLNCYLLYRMLRKKEIYTPSAHWKRFIGQLLFANIIMALVVYFMLPDVSVWLSHHAGMRVLMLLGYISLSVIIYIVSLLAVGIRPNDFRGKVREAT